MATAPEQTPDQLTEQALEVRFGQVGLTQLRIRTADCDVLKALLSDKIRAAPSFFERTPVGLDLSALERSLAASELREMLTALRATGVLLVGLMHGSEAVDDLAGALDLPVLRPLRRERSGATAEAASGGVPASAESAPGQPPAAASAAVETPSPEAGRDRQSGGDPVPRPTPSSPGLLPPLLHEQAVRSGQRVYAQRRDLIVTGNVGQGAEVMADGFVHVYGALRGRALAGATGNESARVFCQQFRAELISVAGVFRVFETLPEDLDGRPVQAWLAGDDLRFARMGG
ncbi:MAG: septum site-determining protein MinC [Gammaproteobacteria bacterium]|nr:septum site-determining protein MinC [Gammaproteobacteria bacterium]